MDLASGSPLTFSVKGRCGNELLRVLIMTTRHELQNTRTELDIVGKFIAYCSLQLVMNFRIVCRKISGTGSDSFRTS